MEGHRAGADEEGTTCYWTPVALCNYAVQVASTISGKSPISTMYSLTRLCSSRSLIDGRPHYLLKVLRACLPTACCLSQAPCQRLVVIGSTFPTSNSHMPAV